MSFILHIWEKPVPASLEEAIALVDEVSSRPEDTPTEKFKELGRALWQRFPVDDVDDWVWEENPSGGCDEPLWNLQISSRHVNAVVPVVAELAAKLGLVVLDPQNAWYVAPRQAHLGPIVSSFTKQDFAAVKARNPALALSREQQGDMPGEMLRKQERLTDRLADMMEPVLQAIGFRRQRHRFDLHGTTGVVSLRITSKLLPDGSLAFSVLLGVTYHLSRKALLDMPEMRDKIDRDVPSMWVALEVFVSCVEPRNPAYALAERAWTVVLKRPEDLEDQLEMRIKPMLVHVLQPNLPLLADVHQFTLRYVGMALAEGLQFIGFYFPYAESVILARLCDDPRFEKFAAAQTRTLSEHAADSPEQARDLSVDDLAKIIAHARQKLQPNAWLSHKFIRRDGPDTAIATLAMLPKARWKLLVSLCAGIVAPVLYFLDLRIPFIIAALVNIVAGLYGAKDMSELVEAGSAGRAVLLGSFFLPPACIVSIAWLLAAGGRMQKAINDAGTA